MKNRFDLKAARRLGEEHVAGVLRYAARFRGVVTFEHIERHVAPSLQPGRAARRLTDRMVRQKLLLPRGRVQLARNRAVELFAVMPRGVILGDDFGIDVPDGTSWGSHKGRDWWPPASLTHDLRAMTYLFWLEVMHRALPEKLPAHFHLPENQVRAPIQTFTEYELSLASTRKKGFGEASEGKRADGAIIVGNKLYLVEVEGAHKYGERLTDLARSILEVSQGIQGKTVVRLHNGLEVEMLPSSVIVVLPHKPPIERDFCINHRRLIISRVIDLLKKQAKAQAMDEQTRSVEYRPTPDPVPTARVIFVQERKEDWFDPSPLVTLTPASNPQDWMAAGP